MTLANSKRRCAYCRKSRLKVTMIITPILAFCCSDHRYLYGIEQTDKLLKKTRQFEKKKHTEQKRKDRESLKRLMSRSQWYNRLQTLVNQYVKNVRDKDKGCCTCGKTKPTVKYDAGHCFTRAARPDIRFDLHNIHKQCSVNCNQQGKGMVSEHKLFIVNEYGQEELERLTMEGESLKVQFPTWQDIEEEMIRYRKLLRDNGIKPNL